jgi:flagellar biosynthesis/type III secretory pathway chaperone
MKVQEITIAEKGLSPEKASDILITLIDNQITNYNRIKFIEWERNKLNSQENVDQVMEYLIQSKSALKSKLKNLPDKQASISFSLSIEINAEVE